MHNTPHSDATKKILSEKLKGLPNYKNRREMRVTDGLTLYRCGACLEFKPFEDFYKNKRTVFGITSACKKCHMESSIRTRDKEKARERNKLYARRAFIKTPEEFKERWRKYKREPNEKTRARILLHSALKKGQVIKPEVCEECQKPLKLTAHHEDYNNPLKVVWLCYECHGKKHRKDASIDTFERVDKEEAEESI